MLLKILPFLFFIVPFSPLGEKAGNPTDDTNPHAEKAEEIYNRLDAGTFQMPAMEGFAQALSGFYELKEAGKIKKDILTLIDFSLSANEKRLWVINMKENKILYHTYTAHGRNSGDEFATSFSNRPESYQSSLGFYATAETYYGKHGFSLRLDGLEKGVNDKARERAIVIHGADYVSEQFIRQNGRLGRSLGCPSLPLEQYKDIINTIKEKSCLFVYYPSQKYAARSRLVS